MLGTRFFAGVSMVEVVDRLAEGIGGGWVRPTACTSSRQ